MRTTEHSPARIRVAVVSADRAGREALGAALARAPDLDVLAWADSVEPLLVLGTRADVFLCTTAPAAQEAARLEAQGCAIVVAGRDPVAAVRAGARMRADEGDGRSAGTVGRPRLSARQRDVLITYVSSSDLLPTVARRLGMDPETVKTHLRRIRAKYAEVRRPAPTRRDLYVRAVEDGLLPPPSGRSWQQ